MSGQLLRLRERVAAADRALDPRFARAVAQQWVDEHLPGRSLSRTTTHTALYGEDDAVSVRISVELDTDTPDIGGLTLLVRVRAADLSVTAFPDDPTLPTLPAMLDPGLAVKILTAHPGLGHVDAASSCRVTVVHHPRTGACVLRYDLVPLRAGTRPRQVYAKVYPGREEAVATARAVRALGAIAMPGEPGIRVRLPRLLGLAPERHTIFLESLSPPPEAPRAGAYRPVTVHEAAQALRALHRHAPRGALPTGSPAAELRRVDAELAVVAGPWPDVADHVAQALGRARRTLQEEDGGALVLSHGDFTPSQLVRLPRSIGLVDLDTVCLSEAASDVGRYLAYHDLAAARRHDANAVAARTEFLAAYARADAAFAARVDAYRRLSLGLHALRAARRFKDDRVIRALTMLQDDATGGSRP
ncbi:hypothetical protein [Georgenia sp. SYP-B2076]|uniref:hypothetical protein n=1 Tax=Georgenia sp. SYP-B2076 TaxID=2495881 RepID=UPI000F8EDF04|nr:hypothetical protein [Georgenia sp. SYP-B2076]